MSHILFYTDSYGIYGVEPCNHTLRDALEDAGYEVSFAQSSENFFQSQLNSKFFEHEGQKLQFQDQVKDLFVAKSPDLILFSDTSPFANLWAKQAAIELGIPYFISVHGSNPKWAETYAEWIPKLPDIYQKAQTVIGSSQLTLDLLNGIFRLPFDRGAVIYNGLSPLAFETANLGSQAEIREELNIPAEAVVCFTVANLSKAGGIEHLLQAASELKQRPNIDDLYFLWMDTGDHQTEIAERLDLLGLSDRVHIIPFRTDVSRLFDCADMYVASTEFEGLSLVVMQAMAKGLPVIASSVGDLPEIIDESSFLLPNPIWGPIGRVLAKTILWMTESKELRIEVGEAGKKRAAQFFEEEAMVNSYLTIIGALLNRLSTKEKMTVSTAS